MTHETEAIVTIDLLEISLPTGVAKFVQHETVFVVVLLLSLGRLYILERTGAEEGTRTSPFRQFVLSQQISDIY